MSKTIMMRMIVSMMMMIMYFCLQEKVFPFPEPLNEEQMATLNMLVEPIEKYFEEKGNNRICNCIVLLKINSLPLVKIIHFSIQLS